MKIKNIFLGFLSLFLILGITSCNDFLKEEPQTNPSLEQYYKTANHGRASVNTLYRSGVTQFYDAGVYNGANIMFGSYLSGFYDNEYKGQEVIAQYSQELTISPMNIANQTNDIWRLCYEAISRANACIKYIPNIHDLNFTDEERTYLMAQAKFFRAMNYFHLVKFFGDVPLITSPVESMDDKENIYKARTASSEVYTLIEADLKDAIANLKEGAFAMSGFHVTKTTAEMLLANVYLQMSGYPLQNNRYADAAVQARLIIKSGKHSLTANIDEDQQSAYNIIRTTDQLNEFIYTKEYVSSISHSGWVQISFPVVAAGWGVFKYSLTNNASRPVKELLNVYDPSNDLRIKEKQFFFSEYTYEKNGVKNTVKFEQPSQWFYFDRKAMFETGISDRDFPIFRYPEALLVAAEAIAQSEGITPEAIGYLADVRARAYTKMTKAEIIGSLSGLSKDAFVQEVWTERIREFSLEHKIWDDIQRTRMYPTTSASNKGKVTYVNVIGAKNPWGATFKEKHLLWPISNNEMQRNPKLVQNPGY